ncbi:MAG TPA: hypothetical protein PLV42_03560 [bacterium]|nr:hypothetical protein [bacterium]
MEETKQHSSTGRGIWVAAILFAAAAVLFAALYFKSASDDEQSRAELAKVKQEQIALMNDYKAALEENHKLLTQSLSERYFDHLIGLRNRIEQMGYTPTTEEKKVAFDRAAFIVENMGALDLPAEEAKLRLQYIVTTKNLLEKPVEPAAPVEKTSKK